MALLMVTPCPLKGICLVPSPEHLKIIQKRLDSIKCLSRTLNFALLTKGKHINLLLLPDQQQSSNLTKRYLRIWSRLKKNSPTARTAEAWARPTCWHGATVEKEITGSFNQNGSVLLKTSGILGQYQLLMDQYGFLVTNNNGWRDAPGSTWILYFSHT